MEARFGKFVLVDRIAEGGMGEVFLAHQRGLGHFERFVVLKRLRSVLNKNKRFESLFMEEARISARLSHPNVVQVYEFGRIEESYFLTLEHVRGATLSAVQRRLERLSRTWPLEVLLEVMSQMCAGLSYVHRLEDFDGNPLGIVHSDISPANIMVSRDGQVKLLDFGIAHARGALEEARSIRGKYAYVSPEQCRMEKLDERSDLFSAGVVFWELLTQTRLFRRPSNEETVAAVLVGQVPPPSSLRPDLPSIVDEIAMNLLHRDRSKRYTTAAELGSMLELASTSLGLSTGPRAIARFMTSIGEGVDVRTPAPRMAAAPMEPTQAASPVDDGAPVAAPPPRAVVEVVPELRSRLPAPSARPATRSLLLVDDEEENLDALRRVFRNRGFQIYATTQPTEAVKLLEDNPIDLVITDLRMPGMSGIELLLEANKLRPQILKVIASAHWDGNVLLGAINQARVHRYILKPWAAEELTQMVDELLASQLVTADATLQKMQDDTARLEAALPAFDPASVTFLDEEFPTTRMETLRRRRLRPELIRATRVAPRLALVIMGGTSTDEEASSLARWISAEVESSDPVLILRPEKLAVILLDSNREAATALAKRFCHEAIGPGGPLVDTGARLDAGIAVVPDDTTDVDELIMQADMALFQAVSKANEGAA